MNLLLEKREREHGDIAADNETGRRAAPPEKARGSGTDVPRVRIGRGHGKILFREEDVELYIRSHVETKGVRGSLELRQVDIASFR